MRRSALLAILPVAVAAAVMALAPVLGAGREPDGPVTGPLVVSTRLEGATLTPATALWDSRAGQAVLTASNVRPGLNGVPIVGQVTVRNLAAPAAVGLQETAVVSTCAAASKGCASASPGPGPGSLSADLGLTVTDETTHTLLFSGRFDASAGVAPGYPSLGAAVQVCGADPTAHKPCPTWATGESHTFTFQVTFPNGGVGRDNAYQGATASASFVWGNL